MKSLVLDDDPISLRLLEATLEPFGEVTCTDNAEDAITAFRSALDARAPFDLVCLDVRLPGRGGNHVLTTLRWIERSRPRAPRARILMVSGVTDPDLIRSLLPAGCDGYVLKPLDPPAFLARVASLGLIEPGGSPPASPV